MILPFSATSSPNLFVHSIFEPTIRSVREAVCASLLLLHLHGAAQLFDPRLQSLIVDILSIISTYTQFEVWGWVAKAVHLHNGNSCSTLRELFQRSLDLSLGFRVKRRGRFVQQQYSRRSKECTGDCNLGNLLMCEDLDRVKCRNPPSISPHPRVSTSFLSQRPDIYSKTLVSYRGWPPSYTPHTSPLLSIQA